MSDFVETAVTVGTEVARLLPTHRQCSIKVKNTSSFTLCNPSVYIDSGYCAEPLPPHIDSSTSGEAIFNKTANTARGTVGVFTYDLLDASTKESAGKIAVMFSVPYDFNLYSNWYAVGIFDANQKCDYDLYFQMYNSTDDRFVRGKAKDPSLSHQNNRVVIMASMSDSYQPMMKVQVKDN